MALTPEVRATQGRVLATADTEIDLRVTQARALAVINFPAEAVQVTQARVGAVVENELAEQVTQARVLALVRGRIENRRLRAWGFSLDGHDYFALRLGETETLVFDLSTGQWAVWDSANWPFWRAHIGGNWIGMGKTTADRGFTTDVVAGDDVYGLLWILDPHEGLDEGPAAGTEAFGRAVTGGVPMRLRETSKCNEVYLTGALGEPAQIGATITLRTSDDAGRTWLDHGAVTLVAGDWSQEIVWRSLGLVQAPGRIFEVTDSGATVRIDGLDMR